MSIFTNREDALRKIKNALYDYPENEVILEVSHDGFYERFRSRKLVKEYLKKIPDSTFDLSIKYPLVEDDSKILKIKLKEERRN